jgi:hypothetical protein
MEHLVLCYSFALEDEDGAALTVHEVAERFLELIAQDGLGQGWVIDEYDLSKVNDILATGEVWGLGPV